MSYYQHVRKFVLVVTLVIAELLIVPSAYSLAIDPLHVQIREPAGSLVKGSIKLTNKKSETVIIAISKADQPAHVREFPNWLELDKEEVLLNPHETGVLNYVVTISDQSTGLFLAKLSFSEKVNTKPSVVEIQTKLSIYLAAIVKGTEIYKAQIHMWMMTVMVSPILRNS